MAITRLAMVLHTGVTEQAAPCCLVHARAYRSGYGQLQLRTMYRFARKCKYRFGVHIKFNMVIKFPESMVHQV